MSKITIDRAVVEQAMKAMLNFPGDISDEMFESIRALKAALAGPAQEPVAYTTGHCENHKQKGGCQLHNLQCGWPDCDRKPTTAPPQQAEPVEEPVAWIDALKDAFFEGFTSVATYNDTLLNSPEEAWENYKPPRAAPPQRRPLTEEEIGRFCDEVYWSPRQLVRAVERAHGIKE